MEILARALEIVNKAAELREAQRRYHKNTPTNTIARGEALKILNQTGKELDRLLEAWNRKDAVQKNIFD